MLPLCSVCGRGGYRAEILGLTGKEVGPSRRKRFRKQRAKSSWLTKHAIPFGLHET